MFRGGSTVKLDAKGRLALPTRYRPLISERFEGQLVLTASEDGCVNAYPLPVWEEIQHQLVRIPNKDPRVRVVQRMMMGHASDVEMDGNGRILVSPRLREFANLDKSVSLVGMGEKFEIWDEDTWNRICQEWMARGAEQGDVPHPLENFKF